MKTVLFSHEDDARRALHRFEKHPVHQTFSAALAHQLLQAAQKTLAWLREHATMTAYWRHTSPNVVVFETVAYFWSMASFETSETVRYAFDDDKYAVKSGMLDGLNQANAILRDMWFGFSPEIYALSRLLLYPGEKSIATERFFSVLTLSEGRDFPLFPGELPPAASPVPPADLALDVVGQAVCRDSMTAFSQTSASLVSHYRNNRMD